MKYHIILFLFLSCFACNNTENEIGEQGIFDKENIHWITDDRALPESDSLFYLDRPAPIFRKEFETNDEIENAKLYITAAGYYNVSINGNRIEGNELDPAWTDFSKRIYYSEFDVSTLIKEGANCMGVTLGNGFYNPLPMRKWGRRNLREDNIVGKPVFIANLQINYKNGKSVEIVSDNSWKYSYGPITKNSVYLGVVYDARMEIESWDLPGFKDELWQPAIYGEAPGGELQKSFFPPVRITKEITPVDIYSPDPGIWIVDMGENFTGTYEIKLKGNPNDTIDFRFGERIYEDGTLNPMTAVIGQIKRKGVGGPGAPDIAWQTDTYIFGNKSNPSFKPEFTYHTYRYMEIVGLAEKPQVEDVKGLFLHSDVTNQNNFTCSSELLNSIQTATERTFLANLVSVQSDCPAREKFGYGGDINATSESFIYNFDMREFYRKTIYDWLDAMNDSVFVDTAPFVGIKYCGISWESAYLLTQYYLYLYYNDTEIIKELYDLNKEWMEKVARIHPDGLVNEGLSDHESLEPVPVQLTGTCHYLQCAEIMETFALVMKDGDGEEHYRDLANNLKELVKAEFWDKPVKGPINRQTLFSTLLYHNIVPKNEIETAKDSLLNAIKNGPSEHFNTGIFGTKYALETLSRHISPDAVFDIVNSTAYPGWGFMIDQGATTIWETWKESDNIFSNCHPMFGTVTEWYYRWLGGIRPIPDHPGFKEFILAPSTPDGLESINCNYHSPYGQIVSNWRKNKEGLYTYEFTIPEGSLAKVSLPLTSTSSVEIKTKEGKNLVENIMGLQTGKFELSGGEYLIKLKKPINSK